MATDSQDTLLQLRELIDQVVQQHNAFNESAETNAMFTKISDNEDLDEVREELQLMVKVAKRSSEDAVAKSTLRSYTGYSSNSAKTITYADMS
jgi:uncharacterized protein YwgA